MILLSGCATPKKSRLAATTLAFAGGAVIGAQTAPKDERKELHSMYWAGIAGLTAAVISNYIYSEEDELLKARLEVEKLKAEMDLLQNSKKILIKEGTGYFQNPQGEQFFQKGKAKWRIYEIDQWVKDGPYRLYHQDKLVELYPEEKK
ncbi:MAG: hypothetical protein LW875_01660 [Proteobacteria bacterium]|nr:hypothetical protein [Pseudomonadota bacterium]